MQDVVHKRFKTTNMLSVCFYVNKQQTFTLQVL